MSTDWFEGDEIGEGAYSEVLEEDEKGALGLLGLARAVEIENKRTEAEERLVETKDKWLRSLRPGSRRDGAKTGGKFMSAFVDYCEVYDWESRETAVHMVKAGASTGTSVDGRNYHDMISDLRKAETADEIVETFEDYC